MVSRPIPLTILGLLLFVGIALANQPSTVLLPGSSQSVSDAIASATDIAIVKFINPGSFIAGGMGYGNYSGAKVRILDILKGKNLQDMNLTLPLASGESLPNLTDSYVIFLDLGQSDNLLGPVKLIPATKDNIAAVKKLMSAPPPSH